jgi:hypothetical protein
MPLDQGQAQTLVEKHRFLGGFTHGDLDGRDIGTEGVELGVVLFSMRTHRSNLSCSDGLPGPFIFTPSISTLQVLFAHCQFASGVESSKDPISGSEWTAAKNASSTK